MIQPLTRAEKISRTMREKKINNFAGWQAKQKAEGAWPVYIIPEKNGDFAELQGVILGDGHIFKFPRTEELSIFSNSNSPGFIKRYSNLVEKIFGKRPSIRGNHGNSNCTRIRIYQKDLATRLELPYSPRGRLKIVVPQWISKNERFIVRYLRGLYEAEGCFCEHKPTGTYKAFFANKNESMLQNVHELLEKLGFHPHRDSSRVQLSRKAEVARFKELIEFRKY